MAKRRVVGELIGFLLREKKYWLIPLLVGLVVVGVLLVFAQSSPVAPFIYTLF